MSAQGMHVEGCTHVSLAWNARPLHAKKGKSHWSATCPGVPHRSCEQSIHKYVAVDTHPGSNHD